MKGIEIHNEFFKTTTWEKESTTLLSSPRPSSTSSLSFSFAFVAEAAADLSFYVLSFSNKRGKKASNEPVRDVHQSYLRLPFPAVGVVTINIHEKNESKWRGGKGEGTYISRCIFRLDTFAIVRESERAY